MTQEEKIDRLWEDVLQAEKKIVNNDRAIESLNCKFIKLQREWKVYESKYMEYLAKRDRLKNLLWWLCRKVTFRSIEITKKELTKRIAKKMARVFHKGGCK
jgi:hypothetical protein